MTDVQKVTQEELDAVKAIQVTGTQLSRQYGELAVQELAVKMAKKELEEALALLETKRREVTAAIQATYGAGTVNLDTGEFTPAVAQ